MLINVLVLRKISIGLGLIATGESIRVLEYHFRAFYSLICNIVTDVRKAIFQKFKNVIQGLIYQKSTVDSLQLWPKIAIL